jgi:murein L,D-transpeptidase YcbB/YkuD
MYQKLRTALSFYQKLLADGRIQPINISDTSKKVKQLKIKLTTGKEYPFMASLKKRLQAEGYLSIDGEPNNLADEKTIEALNAFQKAHHLDAQGIIGPQTAEALNISMEVKVKKMLLALKRWRQTESYGYSYFVRMNIPQFEIEVYQDSRIARKHKVVVGNNDWTTTPDGKKSGRLNRTPTLARFINAVILNPIWRVPPRIKINEIEKEIAKDPDYLQKHGYSVTELEDGTQYFYQGGGASALGKIKLLFPNPYDIYMHDTPQKPLFAKSIRAFSHGCVRVEHPVDLAKFLFENDDNITSEEVDTLIESRKETIVPLYHKVPILIEYNTVGFDEEGRVIFFPDIYGYDADLLDSVPLEGFVLQKSEQFAPEPGSITTY